jgi:outer membrane protein assembly factor BamE (lipoprotein component of BamABCDE complex)
LSIPKKEDKMNSLSILTISLLLTACATSGNPAVLDQAIVGQIKIGQSTKEDVQRLFGKPTTTSVSQFNNFQSEVWAYGYAKHETNPLIYIPVIGLFVIAAGGWSEHESGSVAVSFDKNGIVQGMSKSKFDMSIGGLATPTTIQSQSSTQSGTPTDPVHFFKSQTNMKTNP